ncbi:hypothetical protein [Nocardia camponoti]|uniref:Uncharacterized protein n=1 Tax=Nocardia camponoti TaxID=1616106 RepID=A0A917QIX5_9NOCA|nr:hypothetical protein [Nocardia camponoti]GGK53434.1 hypothetical protein GCM10011591_26590 [Nocardia camponoti]
MIKTLVTAVLGSLLVVAGAGTASAEQPTSAPSSQALVVTVDAVGQPIAMCMMPGDTLELRAGIGAAFGGSAGLPIFIVGAIPGAIFGGAMGALSWWIADQQRHLIPGPC